MGNNIIFISLLLTVFGIISGASLLLKGIFEGIVWFLIPGIIFSIIGIIGFCIFMTELEAKK